MMKNEIISLLLCVINFRANACIRLIKKICEYWRHELNLPFKYLPNLFFFTLCSVTLQHSAVAFTYRIRMLVSVTNDVIEPDENSEHTNYIRSKEIVISTPSDVALLFDVFTSDM